MNFIIGLIIGVISGVLFMGIIIGGKEWIRMLLI